MFSVVQETERACFRLRGGVGVGGFWAKKKRHELISQGHSNMLCVNIVPHLDTQQVPVLEVIHLCALLVFGGALKPNLQPLRVSSTPLSYNESISPRKVGA